MSTILKVNSLEKSYKNKKVIKDVSFEVKRGEILCILGPNGAGKSTTINILTGALGYKKGEILYNDEKIKKNKRAFKQHLGIVPQELSLYEDISAERNIRFFASLYGLKGSELTERVKIALEFAGLTDRAKDQVKTFSGGMKRRLNIACAIAHNPDILIMDEPTVGIDPQSRNHILNSTKKLCEEGMTIIYTTHYMEEVEEISTRIIIMDDGKIITSGTKEELKESIESEKQFIIEVETTENINLDEFYSIEGVKYAKIKGRQIEVTTLKGIENLDKIIAIIINTTTKINNITCKAASLETVFLKFTGKSLRD